MAGQLNAIADARRSHETERDYGVAEAHLGDAPFPDRVDLRRDWHPIADQGHTASCVGWTVADSLVRWHLVEAGRLRSTEPLSARYVWMAAKEFFQREPFPSTFLETDGTSLKAGLEVARKFGVALESEFPWDGFVTKDHAEFNRDVRRRRIMAFYTLALDAHEWRRWMHASGPVAVLVRQDRHLQTTEGDLDAFDEDSAHGSHAAALFGYGPDHLLLRSSWGTDWGDQGYARMSNAYAAAAIIESYGVMV
jgi:C1A family cysteine protease